MPMFSKIILRDFSKPVRERHNTHTGPYYWQPTDRELGKPHEGRGFYQSSKGLAMDRCGSSFALRLESANDLLERGSRLRSIDGYYTDRDQDQTLQPIVARLPRGRGFLPGWTMGTGMLANLSGDIYSDAVDAARAAHDMAESDAEKEREHREKSDCENSGGYFCPKCGESDRIDVLANVYVRLTPDGSDANASHDGSHDYDGESQAQCEACGWNGSVSALSDTNDN